MLSFSGDAMAWSTDAPLAKPISDATANLLRQYDNDINRLMVGWRDAAAKLELAKLAEMTLRRAVFELKFPQAKEGTQRCELGNGYFIKAQFPYTYTLDKELTEGVQERIAKISPQAEVVADRLINWKPELSIKEYRLLQSPSLTPEQKKIKAELDKVLTVKPGAPQLEIEEPKGA